MIWIKFKIDFIFYLSIIDDRIKMSIKKHSDLTPNMPIAENKKKFMIPITYQKIEAQVGINIF